MAKEHSWEIREQAEQFYIVDGLTFEQTAEATRVSVSQLKRWANEAKPPWSESRREYRQALSSIRRNTVLAKAKLIKNVVATMDPQKAYAFTSLETATAKIAQAETLSNAAPAKPQSHRKIKSPQEAIDALQEAIELKINTMLTQPGELSLKSIKEMKQAMDMIDTMRAKYQTDGKGPRGKAVTPETIAHIHELLGMSA